MIPIITTSNNTKSRHKNKHFYYRKIFFSKAKKSCKNVKYPVKIPVNNTRDLPSLSESSDVSDTSKSEVRSSKNSSISSGVTKCFFCQSYFL